MLTSCGGATLFFGDPPNFQELCCITISLKTGDGNNRITNSHQPQILRCRELIFTEPDIIATPAMGKEKKVHIVMRQSLYKTGRLQGRLKKLGVETSNPVRVTPTMYQSCFTYSLLARLAPAWNKVGQYLVQGRNFVTVADKLNAVEIEVNINETELCLAIKAAVVKMPPIKLADLNIVRPVMMEFVCNQLSTIQEYSIDSKWCHVLPSMKKGQVINVCHKIPPNDTFPSYREIKRHWKNTYGYRLPDMEEDMLYYQVYFKPIGEMLFTYPECCLRPRDILTFPRADVQFIMQTFLNDLLNKLPTVCGQKLQLRTKPLYATSDLKEACSVKESWIGERNNVTSNIPESLRRQQHGANYQPTGCQANTSPFYARSGQNSLLTPSRNSVPGEKFDSSTTVLSQTNTFCSRSILDESGRIPPSFIVNGVSNLPRNPLANYISTTNTAAPNQKITPKFKPCVPKSIGGSGTRTIPIFKVRKHSSAGKTTACIPIPSTLETSNNTGIAKLSSNDNAIPGLQQPVSLACSKQPCCPATVQNHNGSTFVNSNGKLNSSKHAVNGQTHVTGTNVTLAKKLSMKVSHEQQDIENPAQLLLPYKTATNTSNACCQMALNQEIRVVDNQLKRKLEAQPDNDKSKKQRIKPKVNADLDVEAMARNNQLGKVNTVTLMAWLKERGVAFKSKDKKGELVDKVLIALNLTTVEQ